MEAVRTATAKVIPSLKAVNFNYILSVKNMSFVCLFFFFSSPENYFGFRTTKVKGKTDHSQSKVE